MFLSQIISMLVCSFIDLCERCGGLIVSALMSQSLSRGRDIVLCTWARRVTLTVPLSTQVCKWVLANSVLGETL